MFEVISREGGGVDVLEGNIFLAGNLAARFVFGGSLDNAVVELADFDFDFAPFGVHGDDIAAELSALGGVTPDAEGCGFAKDQFGERILALDGADERKHHSGAILLHLNGGVKEVESALRESFFDEVAEELGVDVVQVCFENGDSVLLPITILGRGGGLFAEKGAEDIGAGFVVALAEAEPDTRDDEIIERTEFLDQFGEQRGTGGSNQFVGLVCLGDGNAAPGQDVHGGRSGNGKAPVGTINETVAIHDVR